MFKQIFCVCIFLLIAACGFRPLHSAGGIDTARIQIASIPSESGYYLERSLRRTLNPTEAAVAPDYRLAVRIDSPVYTAQAIKGDYFSTFEKITLSAHYTLTDIRTGRSLVSATATANGSYNIIAEPYATTVAKERAQQNLVQILSDEIALHIKAYLKTQEAARES